MSAHKGQLSTVLVTHKRELEALASDTRLGIIEVLLDRQATLSEISRTLGKANSTVHQHLSVLREAGVVNRTDDGHNWKYYQISPDFRGILEAMVMKDLAKTGTRETPGPRVWQERMIRFEERRRRRDSPSPVPDE